MLKSMEPKEATQLSLFAGYLRVAIGWSQEKLEYEPSLDVEWYTSNDLLNQLGHKDTVDELMMFDDV